MRRRSGLGWLAAVACFSLTVIGVVERLSAGREQPTSASASPLVLWAWERAENLTYIDPRTTAVAYLAATVTLVGDRVETYGRRQPLQVPVGTQLFPVVRIESDRKQPPSLSAAQSAELAAVAATAQDGGGRFQIDFDALKSERPFFRSFLSNLRQRLGPETEIQITALASWCLGDQWLEGLEVNRAVPMLFRMGEGGGEVRRELAAGNDFGAVVCQSAYGLAIDEPWPAMRPGRQLFVFSPSPWTEPTYRELLPLLRR